MNATLDLVLDGFPDVGGRPGHHPRSARLPVEPLTAAVHARQACLNQYPQATQRTYYRATTTGSLTSLAADRLAVALLGEHPATIWGEQWWEAAV